MYGCQNRHYPGTPPPPPRAPTTKPRRETGSYPNFEMGSEYKAVAVAFSEDGTTLYVATATTVFSIDDAGEKSTFNWFKEVDDTDLCDIAVNGMSVRVISHMQINVLKQIL